MRSKNTMKNLMVAIIAQILTQILSFVNRTMFIYFLGTTYLGVSGLFSNILSVLSLAELGIGAAIVYSIYKPLAEKDMEKVGQLMNFYKNAYRVIGICVFTFGIALLPFLQFIIKNGSSIENINEIYLIYLTNSAFSYFWAHKRSLVIADQKERINTINQQVFSIIQLIIDCFVLLLTKNFLLYIGTKIVVSFISNLSISMKVEKLYPFLKNSKQSKLPEEDRKEIFKNIKAMIYHKVGGVIVFSTDNLLIAALIGINFVGIYSNYLLIIGLLTTISSLFFNSSTASVGNLNAMQTKDYSYGIYRKMFFLNCVIYIIGTVCLFNLIDDFITLWIGKQYLLDRSIVIVIIANFFLMSTRAVTVLFKDTSGLFYQDRYRPIATAVINLVFSVLLIKEMGLIGCFLGTLLCILSITVWYEPYILYKYGFKRSLREYFAIYIKYIFVLLICIAISYPICRMFINVSWAIWFIKAAISMSVSISLIMLFFRKKEEYQYCWDFVLKTLNGGRKVKGM